MKKILCFISAMVMLLLASSTFASSITQSELDKQTKEGNILSDGYSSSSECTSLKEKYNQEFSNYKRSDCFLNGGKYHYFICPSSSACSVSITGTSTTSTVSTGSVPNQEKLDIFLAKITSMRKEINNDTKYKALLTQVKGQLQTLGSKYTSNTTISQMLGYLNTGIEKIQTELENNTDVDSFLCELLGTCNVAKPQCPIMSAPFCQYGAPKLIRNYKDSAGCQRAEYECPTAPSSSTSSSSTSSGGGTTTTTSSGGGVISSSSTSSSTSSSSTSSGGGTKDYSGYPSGSWEPQAEMNVRYGCTGTVPTYGVVGPINYVGYQADAPGKNKVWRSLYSLSEADKSSDAWKSCTWYCDMSNAWNGNRCVSVGNIRFSATQVKIGETISGTVTTAGHTDSYYACMETPALPNNCASGANFTQLSKNPDWKLNGTTFTLTNYPITSAFPTGQYIGYVAVAENGVVKEPHRTARRHSFNVVPGDTGGVSTPSVTPATISFSISGDILRGEVYSSDPSNTWACMDAPGSSTCSDRSTWTKMPAPGWTQTSFGFALSNFNVAGSPRGVYTGYIVIDKNGSIGPRGSSSFTY